MDPIYLVWDATDSAGGGLDGDGNVKRQGRNVLIRFDRDQACELAVQVYKTDGVGQLVIELTQDGTRKVVSFVGELEDGLCNDYGAAYSWMASEAGRAVTAAVVALVGKVGI